MGRWTERVVPRLVERALSTDDVRQLRRQVCAGLVGQVLEIGFGSGLNVGSYASTVTGVDAVEPSELAWQMSTRRRETTTLRIRRIGLDGQRIEAEDASYESVLSTFTLCTIPDVRQALTEVRRVLRPGGTFHFLEHGRAPDDAVRRWQHRLDPIQRRVAGGCHLSRDIPALVRDVGLEVVSLEASYLPGPSLGRPWSFGYVGVSARPS